MCHATTQCNGRHDTHTILLFFRIMYILGILNCGLWGWGLEETSNYQLFVNRAASERQPAAPRGHRQLTGCEDQRWLCLVLGPRMQSVFVTTPRANLQINTSSDMR